MVKAVELGLYLIVYKGCLCVILVMAVLVAALLLLMGSIWSRFKLTLPFLHFSTF